MTIGNTVVRTTPNGDVTEHTIENEAQLNYHLAMQAEGMEYTVKQSDDWLVAAKPTMRVHRTLQNCTAC